MCDTKKFLEQKCFERQMRVKDLAEMCKVAERTAYRWMKGKPVSEEHVERIAAAFGVSCAVVRYGAMPDHTKTAVRMAAKTLLNTEGFDELAMVAQALLISDAAADAITGKLDVDSYTETVTTLVG